MSTEPIWRSVPGCETWLILVSKNALNLNQDWEGQVAAPLGGALPREALSTLTLLMPGRSNF